jgi:hypothetical protein
VGYTKLKVRDFPAVYQAYASKVVERDGKKLLVLEGHSGGSILGGRNNKDSKRDFIRLVIDRRALLDDGPGLTSNRIGASKVFVYRGVESNGADGVVKECVAEVMDRSRPYHVQIDGLEGESFDLNQTIKLVGNIPLKKLSLTDIPDELREEAVELCR